MDDAVNTHTGAQCVTPAAKWTLIRLSNLILIRCAYTVFESRARGEFGQIM